MIHKSSLRGRPVVVVGSVPNTLHTLWIHSLVTLRKNTRTSSQYRAQTVETSAKVSPPRPFFREMLNPLVGGASGECASDWCESQHHDQHPE